MKTFTPAYIQYSYKLGFYKNGKLEFTFWVNGAKDSIDAENAGRDMCKNEYHVTVIDREG